MLMEYYKKYLYVIISLVFVLSSTNVVFAVTANLQLEIVPLPECSDTIDNDGDGLIDFPDDPECDNSSDDSESPLKACEDGIDNDGDSLIDFPDDPGCASAVDDNEQNSNSSGSSGNSGGSGSSGSSGAGPSVSVTSVSFSGRAYPLSSVSVLKDGVLVATTIAGPDAIFSITLSNLSSGNFSFSVFSEDSKKRRSTLFTFPVYITRGASTQVSGIYLSPTISTDKTEVRKGDNIAIFGQSSPNATVTINVNSQTPHFVTTQTDESGAYLYNFDTAVLEIGSHTTQSKATYGNDISPFGDLVNFSVGNRNIERGQFACSDLPGDLNCDGRVNLVDFSIAAFWYNQSISSEFLDKESQQLNNDGEVDLVDFSIMAFYWTG